MFKKLLVLSIAAVGMSFAYAQEAPATEGSNAKVECKCGDDCKCDKKKSCKKECAKKCKEAKSCKGEKACKEGKACKKAKEAAAPKAE